MEERVLGSVIDLTELACTSELKNMITLFRPWRSSSVCQCHCLFPGSLLSVADIESTRRLDDSTVSSRSFDLNSLVSTIGVFEAVYYYYYFFPGTTKSPWRV